MGYYTGYSLDITGPDALVEKATEYIVANEEMNYALGEDLNGGDNCKWYDHEEDMIKLSNLYPELLFTLEGNGEESDDQWKKYFIGGKMQAEYVKVLPPEPFDPNKLKTLKEIKKEQNRR